MVAIDIFVWELQKLGNRVIDALVDMKIIAKYIVRQMGVRNNANPRNQKKTTENIKDVLIKDK